jgi:hemolysin D
VAANNQFEPGGQFRSPAGRPVRRDARPTPAAPQNPGKKAHHGRADEYKRDVSRIVQQINAWAKLAFARGSEAVSELMGRAKPIMAGVGASSRSLVPAWHSPEAKDPTLPAILEFQWPSTAIVNAPVPRSARGIVWMITSMVAVLILAAGVIPVDRVVTARGVVISQAPTILVQPLDTSIVRSIDVSEGDRVSAGQVLARLDPTFASADQATLAVQVTTLEAEVTRLQAEADAKPFNYSGNDPNWLLQAAIHGHRVAEFDAKLQNYRNRVDELNATISKAEADAIAYRERLQVAESVELMRKQLAQSEAGSRLELLKASDARAEMARALANAQQTEEGAKRDLAALMADRDGYIQGWNADVSEKLAQANSKLNDAREQLRKAQLHKQLVELRSDRDAIVQSVAKVSVGSVLQSGQHFITLVPTDAKLEVESNIAGNENGFVHVGDPVVIKFDTFAYAQYGLAYGTVRAVSPTSFTEQDEVRNPTSNVPISPTTNESFYRARITIDRVALHDVPDDFHLIPGMPVTSDVKVGKRTVLGYLIGMVVPVAHEALREP